MFVAQRLMEFDVETRCGASYSVKSEDRSNSLNGYRDRLWQLIPKLPQQRFLDFPGALAHHREGTGCSDPGGLCVGRRPARPMN